MKKRFLLDIMIVFLLIIIGTFLFIVISLYKSRTVYSFNNNLIVDKDYFTASIQKSDFRPRFIHSAKDNFFTENVEFRNFVKSHPENYQSYINFYNKLNVPFSYIDKFKKPVIDIKSEDLTYIYKSSNGTFISLLKNNPRFLIRATVNTIKLYNNGDLIITLKDENFNNGTIKVYIPEDKINTSSVFEKYKANDKISLEGYIDTNKTTMTYIIFYCTAVSE